MDNKITIQLGLYTKYSKDILKNVINTYMCSPGGIATYTFNYDICNVEQEPDGEVVLKINTDNWQYSRSSWRSRSRSSNIASMKQFFIGQFVKCIKNIIIPNIRYNNNSLKSIKSDEVESMLWNIDCHEYHLTPFIVDDNHKSVYPVPRFATVDKSPSKYYKDFLTAFNREDKEHYFYFKKNYGRAKIKDILSSL